MDKLSGFVAYPSAIFEVSHTIIETLKLVNRSGKGQLKSWEENDIAGRPLTTPIFKDISSANILIADVTHLNFSLVSKICG